MRKSNEAAAPARVSAGLACVAAALLAGSAPTLGDNVPFAEKSPIERGAYVMSLADIMTLVQARHIKLGEAVKAKNWPLAAFEARLLYESLGAAAILYVNVPVDQVIAAGKPLAALGEAAKINDAAKIAPLFAELTLACNACHEAAGIPFVKIKAPAASPFADQVFEPDGK